MRFKIALWTIIISTIILFVAFFALYTTISQTFTSWEEKLLINTVDSILVKIAENPELLQTNPKQFVTNIGNDYLTYVELYTTGNAVIAHSANLKHLDLPCDPVDTHYIQRLKLKNGSYLRIYQDAIIINEQTMGYVVAGIPITQHIYYLKQFRLACGIVLLCTIILLGYVIYTLLSADIVHTQRTFLSFASHELRTGLCAIAGEAELLQRKKQNTQEYKEGLHTIEKSAQELMQTITTWLTLFRNQVSPQKNTVVNIQEILVRAVTDTQQRYPDRSYTTQTVPCWCLGHTEQLYEAFRNLLENAAKYSPAHTTITTTMQISPTVCILTIKNPGNISPIEQKRIFKPFYRANRSPQNGFGIGLALVYMVIQQHHGKIKVQSTSTATTFTITLPRKNK